MSGAHHKARLAVATAVTALVLCSYLLFDLRALKRENLEMRKLLAEKSSAKAGGEAENASGLDSLSSDEKSELLRLRGEVAVFRQSKRLVDTNSVRGELSSAQALDEWPDWMAKLRTREITREDFPNLISALNHPNPTLRLKALTGLQQIGLDRMLKTNLTQLEIEGMKQTAATAIPSLLATSLNDPDARVRQQAVLALGFYRQQPETVIPTLIQKLSDPEQIVVRAALNALGRFEREAVTALPYLQRVAQSADENLGVIARDAISLINPGSPN